MIGRDHGGRAGRVPRLWPAVCLAVAVWACAMIGGRGVQASGVKDYNDARLWNATGVHDALAESRLSVLWMAPFFSAGGYCSEATTYVTALNDLFRVGIEQHGDSFNYEYVAGLPGSTREALQGMLGRGRNLVWRASSAITVCHSEPGAWHPPRYQTSRCPPEGAAYSIGRTMFETDRLPSGWDERLNKMDEVWVPTKFHYDVFVEGGVDESKLVVVPEAADVDFFDPARVDALPLPGPSTINGQRVFRFLSVFKWEYRKGWDVLLKAYVRQFSRDDAVVLYILTSAYHSSSDFDAAIAKFLRKEMPDVDRDELPRMQVLTKLEQTEMPMLYKAADAFVLPSRGEGWGRPHVEAMSMGLPLIATHWSGPSEYMTTENSYPLRHDSMEPIPEGAFKGHLMAEPSVGHLQELMQRVWDKPEEAKARGDAARRDMVQRFHPQRLAQFLSAQFGRIATQVERRRGANTGGSDHDGEL